MQLILDDENAVDVKMATYDESHKEIINGVSAEVNECNGNKENVEQVNSKDILCEEFQATTDIARSEISEVAKGANDLKKSPNDNHSTLLDSNIVDKNENEAAIFVTKTALDITAEPCENMTDLVKEDLFNVEEQCLAADEETKRCELTANIENSKNVEIDNLVDNKSQIDDIDVKETDQKKTESMDVDKNASIEEVSDKTENQVQKVSNNISTELSASRQDIHGIQEDSQDVSMEEVSLPQSVDEKFEVAVTSEPKDEGIVYEKVDKNVLASTTENTIEETNSISITRTEGKTEIIDINSKLDKTEEKNIESEAIKDLNEVLDIESTLSTEAQAVQGNETKENDTIQINTTPSMAKTDSSNEAASVTPSCNDKEHNNVSKILTISNEVIEKIEQRHENEVEFKNGAPEEKPEEVNAETKILEKNKDNNILEYSEVVNNLELESQSQNIKTTAENEIELKNGAPEEKSEEVNAETKILEKNKENNILEYSEVVNNLELESQSQNIKTTAESIQNADFDASNTPAPKKLTENSTDNADGYLKSKDETVITKKLPIRTSRLSNTLDILSDDEDDIKNTPEPMPPKPEEKHCISIDDDDDVLLVDDIDSNSKCNKLQPSESKSVVEINEEIIEKKLDSEKSIIDNADTEPPKDADTREKCSSPPVNEKMEEDIKKEKPFVPENFLKTCKKSVAEMTREELEEFCVLRIVESVLDKSSLNDIKTKLKSMAQNIEEYKKKAMLLTKQNRDLQVVLKSVQEELKKNTNTAITPLKITRSVGMQVLMVDKAARKKGMSQVQQPITNTNIKTRNTNNKPQAVAPSQPIPVPRLVPAQNSQKTSAPANNQKIMPANGPSSAKKTPAVTKAAEKRQRTSSQSFTVDLTDDEPPAKAIRNVVPPVRLVNQQSLMASKPNTPQGASPRKVFIPISSQTQAVRPGQAIMLRPPAPIANTAVRGPNAMRMRMPNSVRVMRMNNYRHPAPLPDHVKQYQPPNWKALPPSPDLKLSKVENGIVISWKIDGYQEDSHEEIASYQLYAYQETSVAPSTSLWKKIGDVKALPLPMACTLTQFMTGYKYYFAVRAVDIRSRVGPFSLPGSILLLNKV